MNFPQIEHTRVGFANGRTFGRVSVPRRCVDIVKPSSPLKQAHCTRNGVRLGAQRAESRRTSHVIVAVCKLGSLKYSGYFQTEEFSNSWVFRSLNLRHN